MQPNPKFLPPLVQFKREVPPVRRVPLALARRFFQVCITALAEALDREDLTPLQYGVMAYVIGEPDIDQSGVAARLGIDRNNAKFVVERLEAKGLIFRRVNGADRRAKSCASRRVERSCTRGSIRGRSPDSSEFSQCSRPMNARCCLICLHA